MTALSPLAGPGVASTRCRGSFVDSSHVRFYSSGARLAAVVPPRRPRAAPACGPPSRRFAGAVSATAAPEAPAPSRRARVQQHMAAVETTLQRLEEAGPLSSAALPRQLLRRSRRASSSSSSSESSDSSSEESEPEAAVSARLARRLQARQQLLRQQLLEPEAAAAALMNHIVAAPAAAAAATAAAAAAAAAAPSAAPAASSLSAPPAARPAAPAAAATATVVKVSVCTGKKCSAAGSAAVLAQLQGMPGVVAQPTKCLKQCKRCCVAEMSTVGVGGGSAALYTGLNAANAAGVLAMHRQQQPAAPR